MSGQSPLKTEALAQEGSGEEVRVLTLVGALSTEGGGQSRGCHPQLRAEPPTLGRRGPEQMWGAGKPRTRSLHTHAVCRRPWPRPNAASDGAGRGSSVEGGSQPFRMTQRPPPPCSAHQSPVTTGWVTPGRNKLQYVIDVEGWAFFRELITFPGC